jgi:hypothetical protein
MTEILREFNMLLSSLEAWRTAMIVDLKEGEEKTFLKEALEVKQLRERLNKRLNNNDK